MLVARPGAGKSTQAEALADRLAVDHLSTGAILRSEVASASPLGRQVAEAVRHGELVPDQVMVEVVVPRLRRAAAGGGYVLDGFPRDLAQRRALQRSVPGTVRPQVAVHLAVGAPRCRSRLLARAAREGRSDDRPETIERRLASFDHDTEPLLEDYRRRQMLVTVDGEQSPEAVTAQILQALEHRSPS